MKRMRSPAMCQTKRMETHSRDIDDVFPLDSTTFVDACCKKKCKQIIKTLLNSCPIRWKLQTEPAQTKY